MFLQASIFLTTRGSVVPISPFPNYITEYLMSLSQSPIALLQPPNRATAPLPVIATPNAAQSQPVSAQPCLPPELT